MTIDQMTGPDLVIDQGENVRSSRRRSHSVRPLADGAGDPQWQAGDERRPAAEIPAVFMVKSGGVASRFSRSWIPLDPSRAAAPLATPVHLFPGTGEPETVSDDTAAQHVRQRTAASSLSPSPRRRGGA
jgi:hypothetical protein